jgi:hypothetical protein
MVKVMIAARPNSKKTVVSRSRAGFFDLMIFDKPKARPSTQNTPVSNIYVGNSNQVMLFSF